MSRPLNPARDEDVASATPGELTFFDFAKPQTSNVTSPTNRTRSINTNNVPNSSPINGPGTAENNEIPGDIVIFDTIARYVTIDQSVIALKAKMNGAITSYTNSSWEDEAIFVTKAAGINLFSMGLGLSSALFSWIDDHRTRVRQSFSAWGHFIWPHLNGAR